MRSVNRVILSTLIAAGSLFASQQPAAVSDDALAAKAVHEVRMYPRYSIFDNINVRVQNGNVELLGQVSEPYKKSDLQRIMQHIPGVTSVTNELEVLPLSPFDNRLRVQVARAIYRDPVLSRYGLGAQPSIHIVVDNGHVTLEGVVETATEKNIAGIRASSWLAFGEVVNHLRVEHPSPAKS